mmetsp:Transcript_98297/g.283661  ORF Transcript_98297/g.283661 Transcript_98297/m.283661 type:complete len:318 (-) Transcript_98297:448-1401(-)
MFPTTPQAGGGPGEAPRSDFRSLTETRRRGLRPWPLGAEGGRAVARLRSSRSPEMKGLEADGSPTSASALARASVLPLPSMSPRAVPGDELRSSLFAGAAPATWCRRLRWETVGTPAGGDGVKGARTVLSLTDGARWASGTSMAAAASAWSLAGDNHMLASTTPTVLRRWDFTASMPSSSHSASGSNSRPIRSFHCRSKAPWTPNNASTSRLLSTVGPTLLSQPISVFMRFTPASSSIIMTPNAQISTGHGAYVSFPACSESNSSTSGATNGKVPTTDEHCAVLSTAMPKSIIFRCLPQSLAMMFSGFKSRCATPAA